MKKNLATAVMAIAFLAGIGANVSADDKSVDIGKTFWDDDLAEYVTRFDLDEDGYLSDTEIEKVTELEFDEEFKCDFSTGIEIFTNVRSITNFKCESTVDLRGWSKLKEAAVTATDVRLPKTDTLEVVNINIRSDGNYDLSEMSSLKKLTICNSGEDPIGVILDNPQLQYLSLSGVFVENMDLSIFPDLRNISFKGNCKFNMLNFGELPKVCALYMKGVEIGNPFGIDLSGLNGLNFVDFIDTDVKSIKFGNVSNLCSFEIRNVTVSSLDLSGIKNFDSFYINGCKSLKSLTLGPNEYEDIFIKSDVIPDFINCEDATIAKLTLKVEDLVTANNTALPKIKELCIFQYKKDFDIKQFGEIEKLTLDNLTDRVTVDLGNLKSLTELEVKNNCINKVDFINIDNITTVSIIQCSFEYDLTKFKNLSKLKFDSCYRDTVIDLAEITKLETLELRSRYQLTIKSLPASLRELTVKSWEKDERYDATLDLSNYVDLEKVEVYPYKVVDISGSQKAIDAYLNNTGDVKFNEDTKVIYPNIEVKAGKGGTVSGKSGGIALGTKLDLEAAADKDYKFNGWYIDGKRVSTDLKFTYTVEGSKTIEARFDSTLTPTPTCTPTSVPTATPTATTAPTATPATTATPTTKAEPTVAPTVAPSNEPKAQILAFVERIYIYVLNRVPEAEGAAFWSEELWAFRRTGAEVAQGFIFSDEFAARNTSDKEFVTILYRTFFGRNPEEEGMNFWLNQLATGTMDRVTVANGFIYSQEWADTCANYGIRSGGELKPTGKIAPTDLTYAFVERMYTTAMGRSYDEEGRQYWASELANFNITGENCGAAFFLSQEMEDYKLSDKDFLGRLYATFMNREADADGEAYWLGQMASGTSRADIVFGFTRSAEFTDKCVEARILPY